MSAPDDSTRTSPCKGRKPSRHKRINLPSQSPFLSVDCPVIIGHQWQRFVTQPHFFATVGADSVSDNEIQGREHVNGNFSGKDAGL